MVKVGDKIKIVNANISGGRYQNGDVFTVHSVKEYGTVFVKEHDQGVWASEYEVVKEMPKAEIKPGDKVRLTDKFYEHEAFKSDKRYIRKPIASLAGREFKITAILFGRAHTTADIMYTIPIELLEKVEPDSPVFEAGKSYVFDKTRLERKSGPDSWESEIDGKIVEFIPGNTKGSVGFYVVERKWCREAEELPKKPKPGDLFKVVNKGNGYHNFEIGQVVELVEVEHTGTYKLRGYIKRKNEVGNQILYSSDLEPYDGKHRYTDEHIAEARQIVYEEMTTQSTKALSVQRVLQS